MWNPTAILVSGSKFHSGKYHILGAFLVSSLTSMILGRGDYFHQNCTWMCLPDLENLTFSIPIFCLISHPSVYHFRKEAPNFDQIGCFLQWFAQYTPSFIRFGFPCLWWKPLIAIPNFVKKCPKRQAHNMHHIPCQCENPPCHLNAPHSPGNYRPILLCEPR